MLKRGTLWLLFGAIALGGGVLLLEKSQGDKQGSAVDEASESALNNVAEGDGEVMFPFEEEDIDSFVVNRPDDTLAFDQQDDGTWEMRQPQTALAEGGAIAFLLSQLTNAAAKTFTIDAADKLADFGLKDSDLTVDLTSGGDTYQLMVGDGDFSGDKRYVRVIEPEADAAETDEAEAAAEPLKIHVVSGNIINAVNRPTSEWLMATEEETEEEKDADGENSAAEDNKSDTAESDP